jgi:hypothetical protein
MASHHRRRGRSEAEREERREAHRRQLTEAVEALLSSEGWARWVRARARNGLRRYSLNNQLLIALQRPEASYVCGFKAWIELGYCVRKGERAIRILAPMKVKLADDDPATSDDGGNDEPAQVFFRAVPVFDRSQVEPLPVVTPRRFSRRQRRSPATATPTSSGRWTRWPPSWATACANARTPARRAGGATPRTRSS